MAIDDNVASGCWDIVYTVYKELERQTAISLLLACFMFSPFKKINKVWHFFFIFPNTLYLLYVHSPPKISTAGWMNAKVKDNHKELRQSDETEFQILNYTM